MLEGEHLIQGSLSPWPLVWGSCPSRCVPPRTWEAGGSFQGQVLDSLSGMWQGDHTFYTVGPTHGPAPSPPLSTFLSACHGLSDSSLLPRCLSLASRHSHGLSLSAWLSGVSVCFSALCLFHNLSASHCLLLSHLLRSHSPSFLITLSHCLSVSLPIFLPRFPHSGKKSGPCWARRS